MSDSVSIASSTIPSDVIIPANAKNDDWTLMRFLRRCPVGTLEAAKRYRITHAIQEVPTIILGVITRYVDHEKRGLLAQPLEFLRLSEDLALDSLSMIEISMTLEDVLQILLPDEKLRTLRTMGDVMQYANSQISPVQNSS
jgi:acyl carrier protein